MSSSVRPTRPPARLVAAFVCAAASAAFTAPARADGACSDPSLSSLTAYALGTNNTLTSLKGGALGLTSKVSGVDGNLIGIDFRPSDNSPTLLYGLTDTGNVYLIDVSGAQAQATLLSKVTPRFAGGYQSLADFNPTGTTNALRVIGSNDQNDALVGATLNQTVVQNPLAYVNGDASFKVDPNITAGAYDTNIAPAASTTFYMIDYDLDTLVTIADRNAAGSSNTGGGQLKTIGPIVDERANPINFAPTAGLDIYTNAAGSNLGFAVTGQDLYCIDLATVNSNLPVGTQQKVVAQRLPDFSLQIARLARGGLIDVAFVPFFAAAAGQADIAVTAGASVDTVRVFDNFSYAVTVSNRGPQAASQVTLSGSGLPFNENTGINPVPSQGSCNTDAAGRVACKLGAIASGTNASVRILVGTVQPGTLTSSFTASSPASDPVPGNNSASVTTTVLP